MAPHLPALLSQPLQSSRRSQNVVEGMLTIDSRRTSSFVRRERTSAHKIICPHAPRPWDVLGENQNEPDVGDAEEAPHGTARTEKGSQEVDRPDLELNYQGNSLVIDLDPLEWIALVILIVIGAWLLHQP